MITTGTSIWKQISRYAAMVAAWFMVLLAAGVAGLWADWNPVVYVGYWELDSQQNTLRIVDVGSRRGVLILRLARSISESKRNLERGNPLGPFALRRRGDVKVLTLEADRANISSGIYGPAWGPFGIIVDRRIQGYGLNEREYALMFPHWFVLLLLLPWPMKRCWGWLKLRRRRRMGLCLNCGYDLRESLERCPECGTARGGNDEIRNSNDERMPKHE